MDLARIRKKLLEQKEQDADARKPQKPPEKEPAAGDRGMPSQEETAHGDALSSEERREHADEAGEGDEAAETTSVDLVELLVFTLAGEYYAFRLADLQEVLKRQIITSVPKMPAFIEGVTSLRGKIIPVMDLRRRMAVQERGGRDGKQQMLILKGPKGLIGTVIDRIVGVRRINEALLAGPPSHLDEKQSALIESVVRDEDVFISLLNVQEVMNFRPLSQGRRA